MLIAEDKVADLVKLGHAITGFGSALFKKLYHSWSEGKEGWDDPKWIFGERIGPVIGQTWEGMFDAHIEKAKKRGYAAPDMIDIAIFCLFRWFTLTHNYEAENIEPNQN